MFLMTLSLSVSDVAGQSIAKKTETQFKKLQAKGAIWIPDNGDGTYCNPIIAADYSDPDVIRVGNNYYMTSSSFSNFPGLQILHSNDLVNWKIIGAAVNKYPNKLFNSPQHGNGIWAPSIRYHNGEFYIFFGDPDAGIFMTKSKNPAGEWEPLLLIQEAKGWIDPCPLWDDDGNAYLVHAWANSRSGIKSILTLNKMSPDGKKILDKGVIIFDGRKNHPTIEGPKIYKRNGYYYIFAPAGGVKPGWQTVLRSKNIYGHYEDKIVLEQGSTKVNGPHQGAWIQTQSGEDWFIHFQDRYAYGRIVHLEPMKWENHWPVMGKDFDKNGIGEPVAKFRKPSVGKNYPIQVPQTNDEFDSMSLGLQWQWLANSNSKWYSLKERKGWLRLFSLSTEDKNFWSLPNLLLQKFPGVQFSAITKLELSGNAVGEKAGLIIFGMDYSYICLEKTEAGYKILQVVCKNADKRNNEEIISSTETKSSKIYLKVDVRPENNTDLIPKVLCSFSYSEDGKTYQPVGNEFTAKEGKWVGSKVGIFAVAPNRNTKTGFADFDWFRFTK